MKTKVKYYLRIFFIAVLPAFLIFSFLTFPFSDLGNLVSSKVAELSGNQVLLNFEKMSFSFVPSPGLELQKVNLRAGNLPPLKMQELSVSPSIAGLLSFKPGVRVEASGLYSGDLLLNTKGTEKNSNGVLKHQVDLEIEKMALARILNQLPIPIKLSGSLDLDLESVVDPSFADQPDADINLSISPFKLLGGNINTGMMGMISLPPISLKRADLEGSLKQNKLRVKKFSMGSLSEPVMINMTGVFDLRFRKMGPKIQPSFGPYDLELEINAGPQFEQDYGVYLSFLEQYKTRAGQRNIYKLKISGLSFARPPRMEAM